MKIHQTKHSNKHLDSLWYSGLIAEYNGLTLYACGEIKGVFEGQTMRQDALINTLYEKGDKGLEKVDFYDSNWFEIFIPNDEPYLIEEQNYDDAIKELKILGDNL